MYIVDSTVIVPEGKEQEVIDIYRNRSKSVDTQTGFIKFQLLQNDKKPYELTVHTIWETKEDYLNWARSDNFKKIHELEKNYPDQELASIVPKVKKYKVVAN
ncbi:antibiotic biosynthesis monooxygenase family protein [Halalkalibacillus halophilus]|uniref:antibiotic biosynthesis monooxygenase family protein n=1 Tax=Halalkalibacillus halophilus TaxID=392827 RepID=UPI0004003EA8|nr:antibiotic biosynthesis monooxygenase [Halalkalibacillus halophilus]